MDSDVLRAQKEERGKEGGEKEGRKEREADARPHLTTSVVDLRSLDQSFILLPFSQV